MADAERGRCGTEARMRAGSGVKTIGGLLALLGMLALASPGVRVARAEDAPSQGSAAVVSSGDGAGACGVGEQSTPRVDRSALAARIAERLRAEMQSSEEMPVPLDGRGYNYRTPRDPLRELQIVESEAKRQREQAPASR
jgi:hypothetical protein